MKIKKIIDDTVSEVAAIIGCTFSYPILAEESPVIDYGIVINDAYVDPFQYVLADTEF